MTAVVFYFQVHQPYRLEKLRYLDVGRGAAWFDDKVNRSILGRVVERCYQPMNALILDLIERTEGRFRCSFAITGSVLSQLEDWYPEVVGSFQALARTGAVEFVCETGYHSLAFFASEREFEQQVLEHRDRLEALFGERPTTFRNTELCFDEAVARRVESLGFRTLLGEGADRLLNGRNPHFAYRVEGTKKLKLLLRDYVRSDDIAFRFSNREWPEYPLMADTFASWLHAVPPEDEFVGLFMDYETFGEHQAADTGILDFFEFLPEFVLADERFRFATPAEIARESSPVATLSVPDPVSWADAERDLSAWLGNPMQRSAHEALYALADDVRRLAAKGTPELLEEWRKLTTSDHVYYMCTKFLSDGDVHEYFSPFDTPHDAFITFMNVLDDLSLRVERGLLPKAAKKKEEKRA